MKDLKSYVSYLETSGDISLDEVIKRSETFQELFFMSVEDRRELINEGMTPAELLGRIREEVAVTVFHVVRELHGASGATAIQVTDYYMEEVEKRFKTLIYE